MLGYRFLFQCLKLAARWAIVPVVIVLLYLWNLRSLIPWIAVPYAVYILYRLWTFPSRWRDGNRHERKREEFGKMGESFFHTYTTANSNAFSPTRLLDQLKATEGNYSLLKPVTYSLLQRAIQRDSALFST